MAEVDTNPKDGVPGATFNNDMLLEIVAPDASKTPADGGFLIDVAGYGFRESVSRKHVSACWMGSGPYQNSKTKKRCRRGGQSHVGVR